MLQHKSKCMDLGLLMGLTDKGSGKDLRKDMHKKPEILEMESKTKFNTALPLYISNWEAIPCNLAALKETLLCETLASRK